jgi:hypothetical protein
MYKVYIKKATRDGKLLLETEDKVFAISNGIIYHNMIKLFGDYVLSITCIQIEFEGKVVWQAGSI